MEIEKIELHTWKELQEKIRNTPLLGHPEILPYKDSNIDFGYIGFFPNGRRRLFNHDSFPVPKGLILPCQDYVLKSNIEKMINSPIPPNLLGFLNRENSKTISKHRENIAYVTIHTADKVFDFLPPIIEQSPEAFIVCDGMHRIMSWDKLDWVWNYDIVPCQPVVIITDVDPRYPYYALPIDGGWDAVQVTDKKTNTKKYRDIATIPEEHRDPRIQSYRDLFRDFNVQFQNVTEVRK